MTSKVIFSNWYMEKSDSNLVSELYLFKKRIKVDDDKVTYRT